MSRRGIEVVEYSIEWWWKPHFISCCCYWCCASFPFNRRRRRRLLHRRAPQCFWLDFELVALVAFPKKEHTFYWPLSPCNGHVFDPVHPTPLSLFKLVFYLVPAVGIQPEPASGFHYCLPHAVSPAVRHLQPFFPQIQAASESNFQQHVFWCLLYLLSKLYRTHIITFWRHPKEVPRAVKCMLLSNMHFMSTNAKWWLDFAPLIPTYFWAIIGSPLLQSSLNSTAIKMSAHLNLLKWPIWQFGVIACFPCYGVSHNLDDLPL